MRFSTTFLVGLLLLTASIGTAQNRRDEAVRDDRQQVGSDGAWVYDNLLLAMDKAKTEKKPVLALIRCVP